MSRTRNQRNRRRQSAETVIVIIMLIVVSVAMAVCAILRAENQRLRQLAEYVSVADDLDLQANGIDTDHSAAVNRKK